MVHHVPVLVAELDRDGGAALGRGLAALPHYEVLNTATTTAVLTTATAVRGPMTHPCLLHVQDLGSLQSVHSRQEPDWVRPAEIMMMIMMNMIMMMMLMMMILT